MFVKSIFLTSFALLSTACSSLIVNVPAAQVQSPVTAGGDREFGYKVGNINYMSYQLSPDSSQRPPTFLAEPDPTYSNGGIEGSGIYSITPRLDASLFISTAATGVSGKYNLIDGDIPVGIYARYGNYNLTRSGNQKGEYGPGGFPWRAHTSSQNSEIGFSVGKKLEDSTLVYGGLSASSMRISGRIEQSVTADGLDLGGNYSSGDYTGNTWTGAFGVDFGEYQKKSIQVGVTRFKLGDKQGDFGFANLSYQYSYAEDRLSPKKQIVYIDKKPWQGRDFGAVALSWIIGFGTGQGLQENWDEKGKYFTIADSGAYALFASSFMSRGGESNLGLAASILVVSRIWQLVDVILDASSSQQKNEVASLMTF